MAGDNNQINKNTPIQKLEKIIFSFKRTHEAAVRNIKILAAFNGDLGA